MQGEILPGALVKNAVINDLDDLSANAWRVDTLEHAKTITDHILVRSGWVMANKGDYSEPDARARLVGCEVNKGGEKPMHVMGRPRPLRPRTRYVSSVRQRDVEKADHSGSLLSMCAKRTAMGYILEISL